MKLEPSARQSQTFPPPRGSWRGAFSQAIEQKQWDRLPHLLNALSNSQFRRSESYVRESVLPQLKNDDFWEALYHLIIYKPQAFISGILAIEHLSKDGTLSYHNEGAQQLATVVNESQVQKIISMAVPKLVSEEQVLGLFELFHFDDERKQVAVLIQTTTPLSYYHIFRTLQHIPDHRELALRTCRYVLKKGDDMSFNMAAILRAYFGLNEIQNQLSLKIEPYELSYLETSFETFKYALEGKKPTII